MIILHKK